jgi:hypothetical protein
MSDDIRIDGADSASRSCAANPPWRKQILGRVATDHTIQLPDSETALRRWVHQSARLSIAEHAVCPGHQSPWRMFADVLLRRPSLALVLGARGAGKSFLSALDTHLTSLCNPGHSTRILGGSQAQSLQIYEALVQFVRDTRFQADELADAQGVVERLLKHETRYRNGSQVSILAASPTSVRGPHVPTLKLDEVDEIAPDLREAAMGMCMERNGQSASVLMTSTWHRLGGPMAGLIDQARDGAFPLYTFCTFEVLERCTDTRSGANLERCPECPLVPYCHDTVGTGVPRAKRSEGHYSIDALIQKLRSTSLRTFEADYLCRGPRADGQWFPGFDPNRHVSESAEYDPSLPVHVAIDSGVFTGAVWFQVRPGQGTDPDTVRVFADLLVEGQPAEAVAREVKDTSERLCESRLDVISTDPAGGARNPVGPSVIAEYERAGLRPIRHWPRGSIADGLALVESFVTPADGQARLTVHPRCRSLINAFTAYRRARRSGQWLDYPEDPQHPHEDLLDALRGGLRTTYPEGRSRHASSSLARVAGRRIF